MRVLRQLALLWIALLCIVLLVSCASPAQRLPKLASDQNGAAYLLGPGDSLRVRYSASRISPAASGSPRTGPSPCRWWAR